MLLRNPDHWTLDEVEELVAGRVPEGQQIEYKRELNLETKSERAELAKDISGFANTQGGLIVFGVAEDDSPEPVPVEVTPLPAAGLQTRLENIVDSTLEPIPEYHAATVSAGDAGVVILLRVSSHSGRPIMVQGYGEYRYYRRSGTRTRRMNASEVAEAHAAAERRSEAVVERLRDVPLLASIGGDLRMQLQTSPELDWKPLATVIVAAIDGRAELIKRKQISRSAFPESLDGYRDRRAVRSGQPWTINAHGLIEEERNAPPPRGKMAMFGSVSPDDERLVRHRVAIYRSGVFEWADRYPRGFGIPSRSFADDAHNALLYGARIFDGVGFAGQLMTWVGIEHAEEAQLLLAPDSDDDTRLPGVSWLGHSAEVSLGGLLVDPTATVREAMHVIWQGFGLDRCSQLFGRDGQWRHPST